MKFQTFALFSAGLLTAAVLSACQKSGDTSAVRDGRNPNARKAGTQQAGKVATDGKDLSNVLAIQCSGEVKIAGKSYEVDKIYNWDGNAKLTEELVTDAALTTEHPKLVLTALPATADKPLRMALILTNLDKNKDVISAVDIQNKVQLDLTNSGTVETDINVECEQLNAPAKTIAVDATQKAIVICGGQIGAEKDMKDIDANRIIKVGAKDNETLSYEKLTLGKALVDAKMTVDSKLAEDLKSASSVISIVSADGKLKINSVSKKDINLTVKVSSTTDKQEMYFGCGRAETKETQETATAKTADVEAAAKAADDVGSDDKAVDAILNTDKEESAEAKVSTTTTTLPKVAAESK